VAVDETGHYLLADLPAGTLSIRIFSRDTAFTPLTIENIVTTPGDTVLVPWQDWPYSKRLFLNTTASGADVTGNVLGFPVLVRLTKSNFDFSQAAPNGRDVRFLKSDDTPLPCEIERWDAAAGQAEIWVRLDTVYGNDATHFIRMLWGSSAAREVSTGQAVFDTADGFQAVWHLGQVGSGPASDATANGFDATAHGTSAAVTGAIGICQRFEDDSTFFEVPNSATGKLNFAVDGTFSVSAWAYADTINDQLHLIAGKGHDQYSLKLTKRSPGTGEKWEMVNYLDKTGWQLTEDTTARARQWTHVVGVHRGTKQYLYVNGELTDSSIAVVPGTIARNTAENFTIGRYLRYITYLMDEGYSGFRGRIDEVRVMSNASNPDGIRLTYMNQKAADALVVFDKK
jgi:biopolymer transport protein ExbB